MSSFIPTFTSISGTGRPRMIVKKKTNTYASSGTTAYTATTVSETGTPALSAIRAGMRIVSTVTRSSLPPLEVYARVVSVNDTTDVITVAEWVGGTPTDTNAFTVNGWVIDLPYCQSLVEEFEPDQLIHNLYRSRRSAKFFGWQYSARLDYAAWISADTLIDAGVIFNLEEDDELVLVPRVDKPGYNYRVLYDGPIPISRFGKAAGHKGVVLPFRGTANVPWPIPQSGYGFEYSYDYGTQL